MISCLAAWTAGGWHLGMPLASDSQVYIKGTTMTFAGIVVAQAGNVFACRTSKASIFKSNPRSNKWIWFGVASLFSTLFAIVYIPLLQGLFGTTALGFFDWLYLSIIPLIVISAEEIRKLFARRLSVSHVLNRKRGQ
jgi:magnesium-transporting ATPase (P-type)